MTKLTVMSCRECPFVRDIPILGGLTRFLQGNEPPKSALCALDPADGTVMELRYGLPPGPERDAEMAKNKRRVVIEDRDRVPAECPLRKAPITVSLGS